MIAAKKHHFLVLHDGLALIAMEHLSFLYDMESKDTPGVGIHTKVVCTGGTLYVKDTVEEITELIQKLSEMR